MASPYLQDEDKDATAIPNDIHDFVERMDKDEEDEEEVTLCVCLAASVCDWLWFLLWKLYGFFLYSS